MQEVILHNDPNSWVEAYSETKTAQSVLGYGDRYYPLEPWFVPVLFESHILMVHAAISDVNPRWRMACRVKQFLEPKPIAGLEVQGADFVVPPNKGKLLVFPRLTTQFKLQVYIPYWFKTIALTIYQYTGDYVTSIEELVKDQTNVIRVDLARIETRVGNP
jgi:hypothetical protein